MKTLHAYLGSLAFVSKKQVLIVHHNARVGEEIASHFPHPIECTVVTKGRLVIELVEIYKPDAIIIDTHLTDLSYLQLCIMLRHHRNSADVPILIVSKTTGLLEKYRCIEAGASDFLSMANPTHIIAKRVQNILATVI